MIGVCTSFEGFIGERMRPRYGSLTIKMWICNNLVVLKGGSVGHLVKINGKMIWSPQSSDLSPIELLWDELDRSGSRSNQSMILESPCKERQHIPKDNRKTALFIYQYHQK
jgi:hypothetical protein